MTKNKKIIIISLPLFGLAVLAGAYFAFVYKPTDFYHPQNQPISTKNSQPSSVTDKNIIKTPQPSSQTSEEIPESDAGAVSITSLNQSQGFVNVSASVSDFVTTSCVYSFTSEGARPVVRETKNMCQSISIPQVEFEKIGAYTLTVTAYADEKKITATKTIDIR